jgi:hypothetical protein
MLIKAPYNDAITGAAGANTVKAQARERSATTAAV